MSRLGLIARVAWSLLHSGILNISPFLWPAVWRAWRTCGPSFAWLCEVAALRFPSEIALHDDLGTLNFSQLAEAVRRETSVLQAKGLGPGRELALLCPNNRDFVVGLIAGLRSGADVLPLSPNLPAERLHGLLESRRVASILTSSGMARELSQTLPEADLVEVGGEGTRTPLFSHPGGRMVVLTSGSSGVSKGINRRPSLLELLPVTAGLLESLPLELKRPVAVSIPLYHGYGIATLAMGMALGSRLVMAERYDVAPLLARSGEGALLVTVPTLLMRWLRELGRAEAPTLKAVITGSAPLSEGLCRDLLARLGPVLFNLYGSTEAGLMALATPEVLSVAPGSVGRPLPGTRVRLVEDGREVRTGGWGEIEVCGPLVVGPRVDGWYRTGDVGRWNSTGHLQVCGRVDSMVISGGENVYPHELEDCLAAHPSVAEVAVFPVPDEEFGQRLAAAVVPADHSAGDEQALREWLRQRLDRHKRPKTLYFVDSLPRNPLGKVVIPDLRKSLNLE